MDSSHAKNWIARHFGNSRGTLDPRQELLRLIGNRLFLLLLIAVILITAWFLGFGSEHGATPVVFFSGILGGIIGLQNRLVNLADGDLLLLTKSLMYLLLAPLVGGFMAMLLYVLFISGLISGDLFPTFAADGIDNINADEAKSTVKRLAEENGIRSILLIHAASFADYGKLIFWSFVAGFSERFVTRIISRFEASARGGSE